jgi:hypothetical protein
MTVFRVVNGQITERWGVLDMLVRIGFKVDRGSLHAGIKVVQPRLP